jgi:DNA uptake protein ComE-like DNA-binding protein
MLNQSRSVRIGAAAVLLHMLLSACSAPATPVPAAPTPVAATALPAAIATTVVAVVEPTQALESTATAVAEAPTQAPAVPTLAPTIESTVAGAEAPSAVVLSAEFTKFNLNTATPDEIKSVPNTGNRMVREFQEYRPYASIQQFRREIGKYVDDAQVAEYEKSFYVPVVPNNADAATLQQMPGVDAAVAEKLIAARPYADAEAFLIKLTELTSEENAIAAAGYVEAE